MKTRNIIILSLTALLAVSCHSWDAPGEDAGRDNYGNPDLKETNLKTIAEVKEMFQDEINNSDLKKVEERMQLKVVVTGNDVGSNLYKSIYVQDNTGAIALSIDQGGLFGAFSEGQCVLIELKDLYVGGYEKQPQIGVLYFNENKGVDQVGRMTRYEWQRHYKLLDPVEGLTAKPIVTDNMSKLNLEKDCGKLVTLVGVKMKDADGVKVFAPSDGSVTLLGGCANRDIEGQSTVVVRTSTYAKFANMVMPTERINITGIASRYRDTWQIMMRNTDDIQPYTGTEVLDDLGGEPTVEAKAVSIAEFNAAAVNDNVWYQLTGTVKNLKEGDQYGNFDLEDETGSVYVYGLLAEKGGEKKKFQELVAAKGIKEGSKLTIIGTRGEFKDKIEVMNAYFVSIDNAGGDEPSGGDEPTPIVNNGTLEQPFTPAEANAFVSQLDADAITDESYYIKGKIIEITDKNQFSTKYGDCTFYISDDGTDKKDKFYVFQTLYLGNVKYTEGILPKAGDEVIICGQLINYKGNTPETAKGKSYIYSLNGQTE